MELKDTSYDWLAIQRKIWETWLNLGNPAAPTEASAAPDSWSQGMWRSWEAMAGAAPPFAQDFFARLLAWTQPYFRVVEQSMEAATSQNLPPEQWLAHLGEEFKSRDGLAFWDLPLDTWRRTLSSMLPFPGDFLQAVQTEDLARAPAIGIRERIDRFLAIPAVGYSREAQEQTQRFTRALLDYSRALLDYNIAFMHVAAKTGERFVRKINEQAAPVTTLRKLFDLWIDACEEEYSEYVMSTEYAALYGRTVNALVAVKHQGSLLVDEAFESMNMPTRREINTMHLRVSETRRANHALWVEIETIKDRLDAQTRMLRELQTDNKA